MYEATITVGNQDQFFMDYLERNLTVPVASSNGIMAKRKGEKRSYLSVACEETYKRQLADAVTDKVADVLCLGYKNAFFKEKLRIYNNNFLSNTLVSTMCVFDNNLDKKTAKKLLNGMDTIAVDGVYNFRLNCLKRKWNEIITLSNANGVILSDEYTMREFLSFLLEAIPTRYAKLSVILTDDAFELFDANEKRIEKINSVLPVTREEDIILNVICNKPQKLTFYGDYYKLNSDFIELIEYLFETKVAN